VSEVRVEPGFGNAMVIAALMRKLGVSEIVLTEQDCMTTMPFVQPLEWWTNIDPARGSTIRLRLPGHEVTR
jgi:hypothetical protein